MKARVNKEIEISEKNKQTEIVDIRYLMGQTKHFVESFTNTMD